MISIIFYNFSLFIKHTYQTQSLYVMLKINNSKRTIQLGPLHRTVQLNSHSLSTAAYREPHGPLLAHPHAKKLVCSHGLLLKLPISAHPCRRSGNTSTNPAKLNQWATEKNSFNYIQRLLELQRGIPEHKGTIRL